MRARVQGTWLDWLALREELLAEIEDLLPDADLVPVVAPASEATERRLATLPIRLDPGSLALPIADRWSPLQVSLAVGWACVLLATGAVLALLRSSLRLSERRGAFVSAVTHELRTPLTTFRMYTEMLSEGMVEHKRTRYLETLRREADRLGELVENVLSYAQIESEGRVAAPQLVAIGTFIERVRERLTERCRVAGMELDLDIPPEVADATIAVDPTAAEQVLFNLVDNAAKYAPSSDDARIVCSAALRDRHALLIVRDFGPGVPRQDARRIFEPFSKAKAHAAGTKPGVGLGLALSRRLARQMGGDLVLESGEPGARFVFRVPRG
jgi:signal transduction histidine kinase